MRRKWLLRFEPDLTRPYVAQSDKGSEAFFVTSEGLVQFLVDSGLESEAIRDAIRRMHSSESRHSAEVELEDGWK